MNPKRRKMVVIALFLGGIIYAFGVVFGLLRARDSGWTAISIVPVLMPLLLSCGFLGAALAIARYSGRDRKG
jgi:hypothetical protein